jgi:la-related protein 1
MATNGSANHTNSASSVNQSPRHSIGDNTIGSPQSRHATRAASSPAPWTQIVRGEPEPIAAAPSSPSNTTSLSSSTSSMTAIEPDVALVGAEEGMGEGSENGSNGNAGKRPAWNKPSNGPGPEVGPVMGGAVSWPALSESTRASAKLSSETLKGLSDIGSPVATSQVWFVKFF